MFIFYDVIFFLIALIYLPVYLLKGKFHSGFSRRFGAFPAKPELNNPIWIHAVSVGEAMAIRLLVEKLRESCPGRKFVFSTVTPTGNKIVQAIAKEGDFVTYLPLDLSFIVNTVINKIKPSIFIIAETEIWPNLINCLFRKKIPVVVVNGRISDSSFAGYSIIKIMLKSILDKISLFCVQTKSDEERLLFLGADRDKIKVTGNMKFDIKDAPGLLKDYADLRLKLGLGPKDKVFVAGSTHSNEEEIILKVYKGLSEEFPDLRLLIAPRHPERTQDIEQTAVKYGFNPERVSRLNVKNASQPKAKTIFILDTIGQLADFYNISCLVFVGGSLVKKGGHNILEPAVLGKAVIFGTHMFNFRDIADLFLMHNAAISVTGEEELKRSINFLLKNPAKIAELGMQAKGLILQNQGATQRNLECIRNFTI